MSILGVKKSLVIPAMAQEVASRLAATHPFERHHRSAFRHVSGDSTLLKSEYSVDTVDTYLLLHPNNTFELVLSIKDALLETARVGQGMDNEADNHGVIAGSVLREIAIVGAIGAFNSKNIYVTDDTFKAMGLQSKTEYCERLIDALRLATRHNNIKHVVNASNLGVTIVANTGMGEVRQSISYYEITKDPIVIIGRCAQLINTEYNRLLSKD